VSLLAFIEDEYRCRVSPRRSDASATRHPAATPIPTSFLQTRTQSGGRAAAGRSGFGDFRDTARELRTVRNKAGAAAQTAPVTGG
jgi:hypothetical protein